MTADAERPRTRRRFLRALGTGATTLGVSATTLGVAGCVGGRQPRWGSAVHHPATDGPMHAADAAPAGSDDYRRHEGGLRWHDLPVTFAIGTSTYPDYLDPDGVSDAIRASVDAWNGVTGTETVFTEPRFDADLTSITFENGVNEVVFEEMPDDSLGRAHWRWAADTSRLLEVDIRLNPNRTWFVDAATAGGSVDAYDVQSVFMHELGHNALLDVTDAPEQTMFHETAAGATKKRTLEAGDEAGWRDAYGTG